MKKLLLSAVSLALAPALSAQTSHLIDLDSTAIATGDTSGTIATEAGSTSFDTTLANASPALVAGDISFTIGSSDGSRVREDAGAAVPNPLTADFVFDAGAGQSVILFLGNLPAGRWNIEAWVWDQDVVDLGNVIVGHRRNGDETIVATAVTPHASDPAVTFVLESDGTANYDIFVRENNAQNLAVLNAVRITAAGPSSASLSPNIVSPGAAVDSPIGNFMATPGAASFSLVAGEGDTHNSEFTIVGDELRTSASWPGHSSGETLSVRVQAVDSNGGTFESVHSIQVLEDSDIDGLSDTWELSFFADLTIATGDGDNDADTLTNLQEFELGTSPDNADTDGDTLADNLEDNDGVFNGAGDPGTDPTIADTDGDTVDDGDEITDGTNPLVRDTDGDSLDDGEEKILGTSGSLADTDGDGRSDADEVTATTNPLDPSDPSSSDSLVAYWPLDTVDDGDPATTPDLSGNDYHLVLDNMTADNFVQDSGRRVASFDGTGILSRVHLPEDQLPINQHPAFTVAMWVKIVGTGQSDLRFFSEGSTSDNNPLFNLGTHKSGGTDQAEFFLRDATPSGQRSVSDVLDGTWRHFALTSNGLNQTMSIYVDGVLDQDLTYQSITSVMDNTSIGGILRATVSHRVTGMVDDVALWSSVLPASEIAGLAASPKFTITSIVRNPLNNEVTLTWNSRPGARYAIRVSSDLQGDPRNWDDLTDDHPSGGETTTYIDTTIVDPSSTPRRFYVIEELQ